MTAPLHFYKSALRTCKCGKPAAYEIRATGNVFYDFACKAHADKVVCELTEAHAPLNRSLAQDGAE